MVSVAFSLLAIASAAVLADGARILAFFPFPSTSHQAVFQQIVRRLAEKGHSVTFLSPKTLNDPPPRYKEILVPNIGKELFEIIDLVDMGKKSPLPQALDIMEMGYYVQERMCNEKAIQALFNSDVQFDLVLTESMFFQESFAAVGHRFGVPTVDVATCGANLWTYEAAGSPYNPSYMVDYKVTFTDRMNFAERLTNSITAYGTNLLIKYYYLPRVQRLMDRCFIYPGWEKRPQLPQMLANVSLVIHNAHFSLGYPVPLAPHFIEVGGVHIKPSKPLPKDIQTFMDGAEDGVIYFSLGSLLPVSELITEDVFDAFLSTFRRLKQRVIWKWETQSLPASADNVYISNWFPQQDILAHKNCLLFISHGGYLSVSEAVNFGVPIIGIPFFGDQHKNMKHASTFGYGIQLDFNNITGTSVSWAINEILTNPSYKKAVRASSAAFKDRPMSALDTAVYWIEYVIRHKGAPQLRPALADLPWYKAMLLDVAAFVAVVAIVAALLLYAAFKMLVKCLCRGRTQIPPKYYNGTAMKKKTS